MIRSFRDEPTRAVWERRYTKSIGPDLARQAYKKLAMIDAATTINDLRIPPKNRLEKLEDDRTGQHSIRINDQFRICFTWSNGGADDVHIIDYH